ncbi:hypothetical protein D3C83_159820 [compost metagenome]
MAAVLAIGMSFCRSVNVRLPKIAPVPLASLLAIIVNFDEAAVAVDVGQTPVAIEYPF